MLVCVCCLQTRPRRSRRLFLLPSAPFVASCPNLRLLASSLLLRLLLPRRLLRSALQHLPPRVCRLRGLAGMLSLTTQLRPLRPPLVRLPPVRSRLRVGSALRLQARYVRSVRPRSPRTRIRTLVRRLAMSTMCLSPRWERWARREKPGSRQRNERTDKQSRRRTRRRSRKTRWRTTRRKRMHPLQLHPERNPTRTPPRAPLALASVVQVLLLLLPARLLPLQADRARSPRKLPRVCRAPASSTRRPRSKPPPPRSSRTFRRCRSLRRRRSFRCSRRREASVRHTSQPARRTECDRMPAHIPLLLFCLLLFCLSLCLLFV